MNNPMRLSIFTESNELFEAFLDKPPVISVGGHDFLCTRYAHEVEMRPIRTPEQIAAEERKGEINELADELAGYDDELSTQDRHEALATYLIDQGYGKRAQQ